ncbi:MAG: ASPIC/UnbV domain-containing protein [Verrucomicrobiales bacterium]|nr:ASPIC/UnbV domain-containing protein [Verrucomicrobiales bacterium]
MRTDESVSRDSFRFSDEWKRSEGGAELTPEIDSRLAGGEMRNGRYVAHSLSGNERNKLFMNSAGKSFSDMSGISGLDNIGDGRGFALFDYNRDGRQDIALVNANAPLFNLYRNAMKNHGNVIAVRFEGSNNAASPSKAQTNRDGFGATVIAQVTNGPTLKREHRCGEGFSAQNSNTMLIGIGSAESVSRLTVRWPSSRQVYTLQNVAAGALVTVRESASKPFDVSTYLKSLPVPDRQTTERPTFAVAASDIGAKPGTKLRLYVTTATWCEACLRHLPQINAMTKQLAADGIKIFAIPIDPEDNQAKLEKYLAKWKPAYQLMSDLPVTERAKVGAFLVKQTGTEGPPLPSSVVTDAEDKVLLVAAGIPTVSDLRRLLDRE